MILFVPECEDMILKDGVWISSGNLFGFEEVADTVYTYKNKIFEEESHMFDAFSSLADFFKNDRIRKNRFT